MKSTSKIGLIVEITQVITREIVMENKSSDIQSMGDKIHAPSETKSTNCVDSTRHHTTKKGQTLRDDVIHAPISQLFVPVRVRVNFYSFLPREGSHNPRMYVYRVGVTYRCSLFGLSFKVFDPRVCDVILCFFPKSRSFFKIPSFFCSCSR